MFISIGSVIIDDIVLPDGTTHMGCLGGGSVHAVMGMRVWSDKVGLIGNIGNDFPPDLMEKFSAIIDVRGLAKYDLPTARAWQLFETDGTRTEIFRTDFEDFLKMETEMNSISVEFKDLQGVHLLSKIDDMPQWIQYFKKRGNPLILWEPWALDCKKENQSKLKDILAEVDCISPNLDEARMFLGKQHEDELLDGFLKYGARRVAIRKGAQGSDYADADGNRIKVPAVWVEELVDQTGAGNAYCGGLVVGLVTMDNPRDALCRAAVSASFPLEQFGALFSVENIKEKAEKRFCSCMKEITD